MTNFDKRYEENKLAARRMYNTGVKIRFMGQ